MPNGEVFISFCRACLWTFVDAVSGAHQGVEILILLPSSFHHLLFLFVQFVINVSAMHNSVNVAAAADSNILMCLTALTAIHSARVTSAGGVQRTEARASSRKGGKGVLLAKADDLLLVLSTARFNDIRLLIEK
jgi:hypothetical protein